MKKIAKKMFIISCVCILLLTACSNQSANYPVAENYVLTGCDENEIKPELTVSCDIYVEDFYPQTKGRDEELIQEAFISLLDLVGVWALSHATDEEGKEIELPYTDWLPWTLEIRPDNAFVWRVYGRLLGNLVYSGNYSFTAVNLARISEGELQFVSDEEIIISYDSQHGLIRFIRVVKDEDFSLHQIIYYTRSQTGVAGANVRMHIVDDGGWLSSRDEGHALRNNYICLSRFDSYHELITGASDSQRIVFTTEQTVRNFQFFRIGWDSDIYWPKPGDVLYSLDELTPEKPLVVGWMGSLHFNSGISFLDENGIKRIFGINDSLKDGSLWIIDISTNIRRLLGRSLCVFPDEDILHIFGNRTSILGDGVYTHVHFDSGITLVVYRYDEPSNPPYWTNQRIAGISVNFTKAERGAWSLESISGASTRTDMFAAFFNIPHKVKCANGRFGALLVYEYANIAGQDSFFFEEHSARFYFNSDNVLMGISISIIDSN